LFSRILVGVDGSPFAEKALKYAIDLARIYHAKLILLHVLQRQFYALAPSEAGVMSTTVYVKEIEAEGKDILSEAESNLKAEGIDCESRLIQGVPADEIVRVAQSENVDLIVLGSRGLTEVRAFLLGSVSDKVSHHAKCPTLIVR
jgi:nucleotide-binding universal stress UspA family protein